MVEKVYLPDNSVCNNLFAVRISFLFVPALYFHWCIAMLLPLSRALSRLTLFTRQHCMIHPKPGGYSTNIWVYVRAAEGLKP